MFNRVHAFMRPYLIQLQKSIEGSLVTTVQRLSLGVEHEKQLGDSQSTEQLGCKSTAVATSVLHVNTLRPRYTPTPT